MKRPCPVCGCTLYQEFGECLGSKLLEVAKMARDYIQEIIQYERRTGPIQPATKEVIDRLRDAIAKAEGR